MGENPNQEDSYLDKSWGLPIFRGPHSCPAHSASPLQGPSRPSSPQTVSPCPHCQYLWPLRERTPPGRNSLYSPAPAYEQGCVPAPPTWALQLPPPCLPRACTGSSPILSCVLTPPNLGFVAHSSLLPQGLVRAPLRSSPGFSTPTSAPTSPCTLAVSSPPVRAPRCLALKAFFPPS